MKKGYWTHPKFKNRAFRGFYERTDSGHRVFVLQVDNIREVFESHEKAKAAGWEKHHVA